MLSPSHRTRRARLALAAAGFDRRHVAVHSTARKTVVSWSAPAVPARILDVLDAEAFGTPFWYWYPYHGTITYWRPRPAQP